MKLVELLAKEMNKWPEDCSCGYCMQANESTQVFFGGPARSIFLSELADDRETAKVTTDQWQAERDKQNDGEWKRHRGGKQPVADGVLVEVKLRDGDIQKHYAEGFAWPFTDCDVDANILKYRVISQPQAEHTDWVGPFPCATSESTVNEIELAISYPSGICSVEAKTEQMETPFKWRDEVTELNAYIEKYTRERDALIERLASEGFALIPPVVSVMSEFSGVDMSDWRNWKAGDVVEVILDNDSDLPIGERYVVKEIESPDYEFGMPVCVLTGSDPFNYQWAGDSEGEDRLVFKFVRRP